MFPLLLGSAMLAAAPAHAGLTLQYTRMIMTAPQSQSTLRVWNSEDGPLLVQTWFDQGDADAAPESVKVPFMVSQPLQRLEAGANRDIVVRVIGTQGLPSDRESVVWLNILGAPQKGQGENQLQATIRQRIKLFWRPASLPGSAEAAAGGVSWRWVQQPEVSHLEARNASAFHVSIVRLQVGADVIDLSPSAGMLRPHDTLKVQVPSGFKPSVAQQVKMVWVNDAGKEQETELPLGP
ncbi:fimbrial assembly chaperone [Stenotrophomonas sp. SKA14]|nr:fimbrial assembly chaperone [Stenotrophomonas sp. SKA14]